MGALSKRASRVYQGALRSAFREFACLLKHHGPNPTLAIKRKPLSSQSSSQENSPPCSIGRTADSLKPPSIIREGSAILETEGSEILPVLSKSSSSHKRVRFAIKVHATTRKQKKTKHIRHENVSQVPEQPSSISPAFLSLSLFIFGLIWAEIQDTFNTVFTFIIYHSFYKWIYVKR